MIVPLTNERVNTPLTSLLETAQGDRPASRVASVFACLLQQAARTVESDRERCLAQSVDMVDCECRLARLDRPAAPVWALMPWV